MHPPFIIYALPRSRTAWLAAFLSYGDWHCYHEHAIRLRSVEQAVSLLRQPNIGCAETGAAPGWQILEHYLPEMNRVVIRRPVGDVVSSMLAVDVSGVAVYDVERLVKNMERSSRDLAKISARPGVLTMDYADLEREDACAAVFEHCLPYRFDREWWRWMHDQNIQADVKSVLQYYFDNRDAVEGFKHACKSELRRLAYAGLVRGG